MRKMYNIFRLCDQIFVKIQCIKFNENHLLLSVASEYCVFRA